jgi:hypothetical protein
VVGGKLDWPLVQTGQEGLCESHFRHDRSLESTIQSIALCEISQLCESVKVLPVMSFVLVMLYCSLEPWKVVWLLAGQGNDDTVLGLKFGYDSKHEMKTAPFLCTLFGNVRSVGTTATAKIRLRLSSYLKG